jgi:hypothetical protein
MPRCWLRRKVWPGATSTECPAFHLPPISRAQSSKSRRYRWGGHSVGSTGAPILIRWDTGSHRAASAILGVAPLPTVLVFLYLGDSLKGCFLETVLRDRREGLVDDLPIEEAELIQRRYAEIGTMAELRLVDLRDDNAVRMGIPTDVVRAQRQNLARRWSLAVHDHPSRPDGIIYPSRLNEATNLAIYDRSIAKLQPQRVVTLLGAPGLAQILDDFRVSLA